MAAISALMSSDSTVQKESTDGDQTPTKSRPVVRIRSPKPQDIATIPNEESVVTTAEVSSTQTSNESSNLPSKQFINSSATESADTAPKPDNMDVDSEEEDQDASDVDEEQGEDGAAARKKKGQRFFCTGYPPCNLSFTRSEHLARHIRKHTGERPFQCHCNRRFSRLDNLRQHAQTVHVNEEIPTDSLAATGTRYQRQIRTDRVRPTPRPRTGTMSSAGSHGRGHSRNLSTSSIGSTTSNFSVASSDVRRRPPPLLMAGDNRPSTPPTYSNFSAHSPGDLSTPTSTTFPATPGSPNFNSTLGSPISAASRVAAFANDARTPGRRLSVPSGANPYNSSHNNPYQPPYLTPTHLTGSVPSNASSMVTSPTGSTFPAGVGQYIAPADDWRRRTWHASSYSNFNVNYNRPATSGLSYSQTPDAAQQSYPSPVSAPVGQSLRLPGIETFDHVRHRPSTPPRRNVTPTNANSSAAPLLSAAEIDGPRRGHISWDGSRPSQYPEIDDSGRPATHWGQQTLEQIDLLRDHQQKRQLGVARVMGPPVHNISLQHPQQIATEALNLQASNKRVKRAGTYTGSQSVQRTSPEDSSSSDGIPTPGTSTAEINPAIMNSNGFIEPQLLAGSGDSQHTVSRDKTE